MTAPDVAAGQVSALGMTAIKATRFVNVEVVRLTEAGALGDRHFYLIDERDRMINGKHVAALQMVLADWDEARRHLCVTLPDGVTLEGRIEQGEPIAPQFYRERPPGFLVPGPFSEAFSELAGRPLRLVESGFALDRGRQGAVSLVSRGSLERLSEQAGGEPVDARRFRMLIEIGGVPAHAEDEWVGHSVQIGETRVRFEGHIGRCLVTSLGPDSGVADMPTLDLLGQYRQEVAGTEPLPFGVHGRVLEPGSIRIGDPVVLLD